MASGSRFVKRFFPLLGGALAALCLVPAGARAQAAESFTYSPWTRVLENYVTPQGQVHYAALKANRAELDAFIDQLAAINPENRPDLFPDRAAQLAYWINAYNAFVVKAVVDSYPVKGPLDIRYGFGLLFFKRARHVAGGRHLSLDHIEHQILRKQFNDPRIHFAVNCASTSCPPLAAKPYLPETIDAQLEEAARAFIQNESNVWMRGDVLFLSKIFDWYKEDFVRFLQRTGRSQTSVVDYVLLYLPPKVVDQVGTQNPRVEILDYDWSLNDANPRRD